MKEMKILHFDGVVRYELDNIGSMSPSKDGEVVLYSDHKAVVEIMQNKIDELEKLNESMLERSCNNCDLFGEGCEKRCKEAKLCFCHDWIAKGIK